MTGAFVKYSLLMFIAFSLFIPASLSAVDPDELYREGKYAEAEEEYRKGDMDNPKDPRYRYNRGCAAFQNEDYKGAAASFTSVVRRTKDSDSEMAFRSSYNLGNTAFTQGDFASAAEYYKMALRFKPGSADAKYNLELALRKKKEAEESQDDDKQCDKDKQQKQQQGENQKSDKGQAERDQGEEQQGEHAEGEQKQDLSGELSAAGERKDGKKAEQSDEQAAAMLEKQKAEALLDNIKEDRAKIMQYQMRQKKNEGAKSGKEW